MSIGEDTKKIDWAAWAERALHVALVFSAAYIAANPKYAWAIPAMQALGQGIPKPR